MKDRFCRGIFYHIFISHIWNISMLCPRERLLLFSLQNLNNTHWQTIRQTEKWVYTADSSYFFFFVLLLFKRLSVCIFVHNNPFRSIKIHYIIIECEWYTLISYVLFFSVSQHSFSYEKYPNGLCVYLILRGRERARSKGEYTNLVLTENTKKKIFKTNVISSLGW